MLNYDIIVSPLKNVIKLLQMNIDEQNDFKMKTNWVIYAFFLFIFFLSRQWS